MSDLDALVRAVLDRPDDDTPRLVFADALDDLGAADRAAFVRAQVEAARVAPWEPAAVRARRFRGDTPPYRGWQAELPELPRGLAWATHPYRRGFPAAVQETERGAFVGAADRLFELAPIESLELAALPAGHVAGLAACPALVRLKRLVIREGLGRETARVLFDSPHLARLDELVIGAGLTAAPTARAVVGSRAFQRLRAFAYRDDPPGGALVTALAQVDHPSPLRSLDLQGSRLTTDGLRRLLDAPLAVTLEALDVGDNHIGPDGFRELVRDGRLPALQRLDAMQIGLGSAGVSELTGSALGSRLRSVNLGGNSLGPNAGVAFGAADLSELRVLDLRDNRLGDEGVSHLLRGGWIAGLHLLDLSGNGITLMSVEALIAARGLEGLIALDLRGNSIPPTFRQRLRTRFGDRVMF